MRIVTITGLAVGLIAVAGSASAEQPAKAKLRDGSIQPLTYANVVAHFKAAGLRATEVQKRCTIFFEGEWKNPNIYDYCVIMVENSDEDVQVTFYLTDAHEMNWVTEFLDAPFFAQSETQKLFGLLNSGRDIRRDKIGRLRVDSIIGSRAMQTFSSLASRRFVLKVNRSFVTRSW
jgi:hypothetical protein